MAKRFAEVFPGLKLKEEYRALFDKVDVERVTATRQKDFVRIYISCGRLIDKQTIFEVEGQIKNQLFPGCNIRIKIQEKFHLSAQYDPPKLLDAYYESILLELKECSPVEYSIFRNAQLSFPEEGRLTLAVPDTVIVRERCPELMRILEKICCERCGIALEVCAKYIPSAESGRKEREQAIVRRVEASSREPLAGEKEAPFEGGTVRSHAQGARDAKADAGAAARKASGFKGRGEGRSDFRRSGKKSDNPDVLYGRDFDGDPIPIEEIIGEMGEVVIRGKILNLDKREIKNERTILIFDVTDFSDTMTIKIFTLNEQVEEITQGICPGAFVKIKGLTMVDKFDGELTIGSIVGVKKIPDFTGSRMDHSVQKRVELHCHTKMSDMDGVSEVKDIVKRVYQWGHPAIAITDHGVVQAFPDANHLVEDLWKAEKASTEPHLNCAETNCGCLKPLQQRENLS